MATLKFLDWPHHHIKEICAEGFNVHYAGDSIQYQFDNVRNTHGIWRLFFFNLLSLQLAADSDNYLPTEEDTKSNGPEATKLRT